MKKYRTLLAGSCALALVMGAFSNLYAQPRAFQTNAAHPAQCTSKATAYNSLPGSHVFYIDDSYKNTGFFPSQHTARNFFKSHAVSYDGKTLGQIDDILVMPSGEARYVLIKDEGFSNLIGKYAVLDYDAVVQQGSKGDYLVPVQEDALRKAQTINLSDQSNEIGRQMRRGELISIKNMMGRDMSPSHGGVWARLDNVSFKNGMADYAILGVSKNPSKISRRTALRFENMRWVNESGESRVHLTSLQENRVVGVANMPFKKKSTTAACH